MSPRIFRDSAGVEWSVWEVHAQGVERRTGQRRQAPDANFRDPNRRKLPGRRWSAPADEPRVRVRPGFEHGWLACESAHERRRFAPIPERWEELSDAQLEILCQRAVISRRPGRLLG